MEQTILTTEQKKVIDLVSKNAVIRDVFYLTGGTALSGFYLYHRYSDDLDFFTNVEEFPEIHVERFANEIGKTYNAEKIDYKRLYDRRIFFFVKGEDILKVEFTYYPFSQLEPTVIKGGIRLDSITDIATNKLMVIFDRSEVKDFVDLYWILQEKNVTLKQIRANVEKKFRFSIDAVGLGSEFAKVKTFTELPRIIKPLTLEKMKAFYADLAKGFSSEVLG